MGHTDARRDELAATAQLHLCRHHRAALLVDALDLLAAPLGPASPATLADVLRSFRWKTADAELSVEIEPPDAENSDLLVSIDPDLVTALLASIAVASHGVVELEVDDVAVRIRVTDAPGTDENAEAAIGLSLALVDHAGLAVEDGRIVLPAVADRRAQQRRAARVLVVEDNATNQILATKQLQRLGTEPVIAPTGLRGVELARGEAFDLILMDWNLPDIDGLEATRRIRAEGASSGSPIVAMTANAMAGDRDTCLAAGMNDFLSKPVRMEAIGDVVATWTARTRRVDPTVLGHRLATDLGGRDVARAVAASFLDELEPRIDAILGSDGETRRRAAHTLKSTASLMALDDLSTMCADIELGRVEPDAVELRAEADDARSLLRLMIATLANS